MVNRKKRLEPEVWLRGPVAGFDAFLIPVAHSLMQAKEELQWLAATTPPRLEWARGGEAATIGFHVQHIAGSVDRLLTYARGEGLTTGQFEAFRAEADPEAPRPPLSDLVKKALAMLDHALDQLRSTSRETLLEPRQVGRAGLPTTVIGLLVHVAEHTTRHVGQAVTTAKLMAER
jgi:uncharacterized damage-inducible protein DinB